MAGNATVVWADGASMIPEMIHVYIDGSSSEDAAAFQCRLSHCTMVNFGGEDSLWEIVILDKGHHQFIGAETFNSLTAELSADVRALTWVAQLKGCLSITLHVDCLSAATHR